MRAITLFCLSFLLLVQLSAQSSDTSFSLLSIADPQQDLKLYNSGIEMMSTGNFGEAINTFNKLLERIPDHSDAKLNMGLCQFELGNFNDAAAVFNELLQSDMTADLSYLSGLAQYKAGKLDDAERNLSRCLGIDPNLANAYYTRALVRQANEDPRSAVRDLAAYCELDTGNSVAWFNMAMIYYKGTNVEAALEPATKAVALEPTNPSYRYLHALLLADNGQRDDAIRELALLIRDEPDFYAAYNELALQLASKGKITEAGKQLEAIVDKGDIDGIYHSNYGYILFTQGEYSQAIQQFDAAISANSDNAVYWYNRGACKEMARDHDGACSDWNQALSKGYSEARDIIQKQCK